MARGDEEANEALLEMVAAGNLAFEDVDPAVVERLGERFIHEPLLQRMGLYFCLKAIGELAAPALPGLARALEDPRNDCRAQAAEVIAQMGSAAAPIVPALLEALQDEGREDIRDLVALALARCQAELGDLESHPSPYVREGVRLAKANRSK